MYIEHFGLSAAPFQLTPDARFWFASRTHRKAMAYLGYGLAQAEGFIVITGEIGAGKSTLAGHLLETIDPARLNAIKLVSTQVGGDDMLRLVAQRIGVDTAGVDKARLLDLVEHRLEDEARAGKRVLLVVDEAQNLAVSALEELRMLSNFQMAGRPLLQVLLLGQPEFAEKMAAGGLEQLRQRVIASHHLEAMQADEVEAYVRHRLALAGWAGRPEFSPDAFAELHARSGGIPRRLNQLANRLLLSAAIEAQDLITAESVATVAEDMGQDADAPVSVLRAEPAADSAPVSEGVLPLRSVRLQAVEAVAAPAVSMPFESRPDPKIAELEARLEEQGQTLRRVLNLLVDWIESEAPDTYRTHAA